LSQDRASRFVVAWAFGATEDEVAPEVVRLTRRRTQAQAGVAWVSDGRRVYARTIRRVYRDPQRTGQRGRPPLVLREDVGLTQAVKRRVRGRVVGVETRPVLGEAVACPYCVHEERLNGVLRDRLNALTRRTHAFAKRAATWDALVVGCLFEHNWIRPHRALRERVEGLPGGRRYRQRTPAMAIGLTDHVWSWEEFLTFRRYQYLKE
jgi:IS1 family transposase